MLRPQPPALLRLRSSTGFIALTVGLGFLTDLSCYGLVVPVIPFRLEALGYDQIPSRTGWLVAAYAAGLIVSSPPIAYFGGRFEGRRVPMLASLLFMAAGVVIFMLSKSFEGMLVARILQGISGTGIWTVGLALVSDSAPQKRVGLVMGRVMVGFSLGSLIGPPLGGILYARMGYFAPFAFALCLLFVDFTLRLLIIEKHVALKWVRAGVDIPGFEAPGYSADTSLETKFEELHRSTSASPEFEDMDAKLSRSSSTRAAWRALTRARIVTNFGLTMLNGVILGGLLDTGLTLWLQHQYGLSSLGAGLVFMAVVIPSTFSAPLAGWAADRYGPKWIAVLGMILAVPAFLLLIVQGPLFLFVFTLSLLGFSLSLFVTPNMQDLATIISFSTDIPATVAYGCSNMMFSIGCFIGPLIAGQVIEALEIRRGWIVMCISSAVLAAGLAAPVIFFLGGPLSRRRRRDGASGEVEGATRVVVADEGKKVVVESDATEPKLDYLQVV